jgi:hypothetical protein
VPASPPEPPRPSEPPRRSEPLRLAFVGQSTYFRVCVPPPGTPGLETTFIEYRQGLDPRPMRAALDAFAPDAVVVFRPEIVPAGVLADVPAPVVGFLTEPIPRRAGHDAASHPDLEKRARDLAALDPHNVDRIVTFDPLTVPAADQVMPVWRSLPIPVSDALYRDPAPMPARPRLLFVGRSTAYRESFLRPVEREFDLLHVAFGAGAEMLAELMASHDVTLNLHNEPYPSFENRVCLHLAAGHLVISEPLSPSHGLEAGLDHLEVATPDEMLEAVRDVMARPHAYDRMRALGRRKAEAYRASVAFPRLASDLSADVAAFGSDRPGGRQAAERLAAAA